MVPFKLIDILNYENEFNVFDNYEVLNGHSKCDYLLHNPSKLASSLVYHQRNDVKPSKTVIEEFLERQ